MWDRSDSARPEQLNPSDSSLEIDLLKIAELLEGAFTEGIAAAAGVIPVSMLPPEHGVVMSAREAGLTHVTPGRADETIMSAA